MGLFVIIVLIGFIAQGQLSKLKSKNLSLLDVTCLPENSKQSQWINLQLHVEMKKSKSKGKNNF